MATQNFLIMNLLRLITPEEIGEVATQHNGGKYLSLTELVMERMERKIYRDFSGVDSTNEIHESHAQNNQAKILPFNKIDTDIEEASRNVGVASEPLTEIQNVQRVSTQLPEGQGNILEHVASENMSTFILIEKARLKRSQFSLKQKEIIDLYQKNSDVEVEQIKESNACLSDSKESGVLINKKHY